jgi:hypothetical protein
MVTEEGKPGSVPNCFVRCFTIVALASHDEIAAGNRLNDLNMEGRGNVLPVPGDTRLACAKESYRD